MTLPKVSDEQRAALFNRGNHFRRIGEFDKALAIYENIVREDDTDAEAHWGAALSRYGIEYVEDPATKKRLPTCHRLQVASILADEDYKAAIAHAPDAESRRLYEEEAARQRTAAQQAAEQAEKQRTQQQQERNNMLWDMMHPDSPLSRTPHLHTKDYQEAFYQNLEQQADI